MKRYTGIQPQYFPRLHYFARILNTDVYMIRDEAQFVRSHNYPGGHRDKSYQADTPIKQPTGRYLLSVPVEHNGYQPIVNTRIAYQRSWISDHLKTLAFIYAKSPNFRVLLPEIRPLLEKKYSSLAELTIATTMWGILRIIGKRNISENNLTVAYVNSLLSKQKRFRLKSIRRSSESDALKEMTRATPNEKIIALMNEVGANVDYCGATGVSAYLNKELFKKYKFSVLVQNWSCSEYEQLYTNKIGFIPNLSILDLLMNVSLQKAQTILSTPE